MSSSPKQVVIVGGGIAGLATAFSLQDHASEAGLSLACTLIEADRHWGGKILTERVDDLLIEAGPDSFLSQKPWALELCGKLGLADRIINTNVTDKKAFVFSRGRLRELPEGMVVIVPSKLGPFVRSGLVSLPGLARMGLDLVLPAKRDGGDESLASFFTRRLGREAFERLVEPLMAGIYAGDATQMSLRATFPRFAEIERQHGSVIRGMLAARKSAGPRPSTGAPARTMFVTLDGGLSELVDTLVGRIKSQGTTLRQGEVVTNIQPRSHAQTGRGYGVTLQSGATLPADAVVLTTPAYVTADLLRPISPAAAEPLSRIPYASTATVSLAYEADAVGQAVRGFGFVVPRVEQRRLLAATWTSRKWAHRAPPSRVLVRCYLGGVGREGLLEREDPAIVTMVREELAELAGIKAAPTYATIYRWWRGMPQYHVGHEDQLRLIDAALADHPGLFVAGAAYRGIGIPDCVRDGTDTAKKLIDVLAAQG